MSDQSNLSHFEFVVDNHVAITPCVQLVLYTDGPLGEGELDFYHRAMAALDGQITHYQAESMRRFSPLNERGKTMVPTWINRPREAKVYWIHFSGSDNKKGVCPANIEVRLFARSGRKLTEKEQQARLNNLIKMYEIDNSPSFPPVNMLKITIPLDHELACATELLNWVLEFKALKSPYFASGHAGFALINDIAVAVDHIEEPMEGKLAAILLRHPGFDWEDAGSVLNHILTWGSDIHEFYPQVKRVNWLTILGQRTLARIGGVEKLQASLDNNFPIELHKVGHTVVIQAGNEPQIGDVSRRDFIPIYRNIAQALNKVRLKEHDGVGSGFSDEAAQEWLEAFERDYD